MGYLALPYRYVEFWSCWPVLYLPVGCSGRAGLDPSASSVHPYLSYVRPSGVHELRGAHGSDGNCQSFQWELNQNEKEFMASVATILDQGETVPTSIGPVTLLTVRTVRNWHVGSNEALGLHSLYSWAINSSILDQDWIIWPILFHRAAVGPGPPSGSMSICIVQTILNLKQQELQDHVLLMSLV